LEKKNTNFKVLEFSVTYVTSDVWNHMQSLRHVYRTIWRVCTASYKERWWNCV